MAEKKATLWLELKDLASTPLSKFSSGLAQIKLGWLAVSGAVAGAIRFFDSALDSLAEEEKAVKKLDIALQNQGNAIKGASGRLLELANGLQKVTAHSNESIVEAQALLATFGMNEQAIAKLTPRVLDMSDAMGIDLRTATIALGKSIQTGSTMALQRFGVHIDKTILASKDLGKITDALDRSFKGTAAAIGKTYAGQVAILKNEYDDLKKAVASYLVGPATYLLKNIKDSVVIIAEDFIPWIGRLIKSFRDMTLETLQSIAVLGKWIPGMGDASLAIAEYQQKIAAAEVATKKQNLEMEKLRAAAEAQAPAVGRASSEVEGLSKKLEEGAQKTDVIAEKTEENAEKIESIWQKTSEDFASSFGKGMADMITKGDGFRESMRKIGEQVLNNFISQVITKMVSEWMAGIATMNAAGATLTAGTAAGGAAGGIAGAGAGTGVGAGLIGAGVVGGGAYIIAEDIASIGHDKGMGQNMATSPLTGKQIHKFVRKDPTKTGPDDEDPFNLRGTWMLNPELDPNNGWFLRKEPEQPSALARMTNFLRTSNLSGMAGGGIIDEPSLVVGRSGRVRMAGEIGPEVVSPMNKSGSGVVINIHAGTIVADRVSVQEFAKKIDEELFRLQRNRRSVAL